MRGQLAGLEHEGVAGRQAGATFQDGLQQRVVPRRDQAADADRLVHDPADHVGASGVDDPAGVLGGDVGVVAEHADDVVDVVLALDEPLAGVERLGAGDLVLVALEQVGDPVQQRGRARAPRRRGQAPVVEGLARGARSRPRRPPGRPRRPRRPGVPSAGQRISRRSPSRALSPSPPDVELRHAAAVRSVRHQLRMSQLDVRLRNSIAASTPVVKPVKDAQ